MATESSRRGRFVEGHDAGRGRATVVASRQRNARVVFRRRQTLAFSAGMRANGNLHDADRGRSAHATHPKAAPRAVGWTPDGRLCIRAGVIGFPTQLTLTIRAARRVLPLSQASRGVLMRRVRRFLPACRSMAAASSATRAARQKSLEFTHGARSTPLHGGFPGHEPPADVVGGRVYS
jgi:hypothetical protein